MTKEDADEMRKAAFLAVVLSAVATVVTATALPNSCLRIQRMRTVIEDNMIDCQVELYKIPSKNLDLDGRIPLSFIFRPLYIISGFFRLLYIYIYLTYTKTQ